LSSFLITEQSGNTENAFKSPWTRYYKVKVVFFCVKLLSTWVKFNWATWIG